MSHLCQCSDEDWLNGDWLFSTSVGGSICMGSFDKNQKTLRDVWFAVNQRYQSIPGCVGSEMWNSLYFLSKTLTAIPACGIRCKINIWERIMGQLYENPVDCLICTIIVEFLLSTRAQKWLISRVVSAFIKWGSKKRFLSLRAWKEGQ